MGRTSSSIYGTSPASKQIYGISVKDRSSCDCVPSVSPLDQLTALSGFIQNLELMFRLFVKSTAVVLPLHSEMTVGARVLPFVGVRLIWRNTNPGMMFDRNSTIHLLQLKTSYLNNQWDWRADPLFK